MSGIVGAYRLNQRPLGAGVLPTMVEKLRHRGQTDGSVWHADPIGLGHIPLVTTWTAVNMGQPHASPSNRFWITADVRLDRRQVLQESLGLTATAAAATSESQLIVMAYERWGTQCLQRLQGDFAFAIWDTQEQELFCARDRFGVKPLYYAYKPQVCFGFASEIKALWAIPDLQPRLNETRIGDYLISDFNDPEMTFYQQVYRLPAAHWLRVSPRTFSMERYWDLDPARDVILDSDQAYAAQFRALFVQAVDSRLDSPGTVGTMLSGGLDSTSIACTARWLRQQNPDAPGLPSFSAVFAEVKASDEREFIEAALGQGGFQSFFIEADRLSPLTADFATLLNQLDEPHYAFNLFLNWNLFAIAKSEQISVILDGFDGDSTVSHGVGYLPELAQQGHWRTLARELRGYCRNSQKPFWPQLWQYGKAYGLKPLGRKLPGRGLAKGIYRQLRSQPMAPGSGSGGLPHWIRGLNPDFVQRIDLIERHHSAVRSQQVADQSARAEHYHSLVRPIMPYTLEVLDKAASYFGIELRFPFWDQDLVEFCLAIPASQKLHDGWGRMVMRRAMTGILPEAIQWRRDKANLGPGFAYALAQFEHARLTATWADLRERAGDYIDLQAWQTTQEDWLAQPAAKEELMLVWRSFNLAQWLHHTQL